MQNETRENAIVDGLDYQIPFTQLREFERDGDMHAANRLLPYFTYNFYMIGPICIMLACT